ncbi:MAG: hypothetical protein M0R22_11680 [Dehalococcoidia bacterium]|jgi:hypothetical protein|nr:hypothetical protein [Dehalococcoidia bacterium]
MRKELFESLAVDHLLNLRDLSGALETGSGKVMLKAVEVLLERERESMESRPIRGGEDVTKSVEYRLGFIAACKRMLALPEEAGKYVEKKNREIEEKRA